ncbi:MAG: hypothetical protein RSB71_01690 [Bacilli bacterium]
MKKIIICIVLILTGCSASNKIIEYQNISQIIVKFYNTKEYDKTKVKENHQKVINDYLYELTTENVLIDLTKYEVKTDIYKTDKPNSNMVIVEDNKCYIHYNDLNFIDSENEEMEDYAVVVCNGYYINVIKDIVYNNYGNIINNPQHDYNYLGYMKNKDGYNFVYQSFYNGVGLVVNLKEEKKELIKITTTFEDVNNYELKTKVKKNNKIVIIIIITLLAGGIILIIKKVKDNNDL